MALLYKADPQRGERWRQLFAEHAPDIEFRQWPNLGNPDDIHYLAAWQAPDDLATVLPNLKALLAISAGVDQLNLHTLPAHLPVARMLDPNITAGMCEYATWAVLSLHRDMLRYRAQQQAGQWLEHTGVPASERRIGLMGLGQQGRAIAQHLRHFGFPVSGWARSPHELAGVQCFAGAEQLPTFLAQCDILICLLPLTAQTCGVLDGQLFEQLPRGAGVINMGRGAHLVEADLLAALGSGQLGGAVLDVAQQEPASTAHPFWHHPRIVLTPHIAAMTHPDSAFTVLLDNIRRHQRGEPLTGQIDRSTGY
ncbi:MULTISPECIES: 2-hydroxyacid dehydrogenase [unclassified Pseudomonas]|uniref:2-hydroxyacid dehydrogenase n=1 Tax=unclassified Pseudomonas TaxID=196821 RepID=UPI0002FFA6BD|nr:glyoxylate/hydroxypyruvate reductase A [Pseudomonas sp. M47T1]